jgi:4'-phosphopantetheinyl transferase
MLIRLFESDFLPFFNSLCVLLVSGIGIDIEKIKPQVTFEGIESHYFSPKERAELETLPLGLRPKGFVVCWTHTEAYVKARSEGLKVPLESLSVSLTPGKSAVLQSSDEERWSLYSIDPTAGFVGALAAEGCGRRLRFWEWSESNL